MEWWNSGMVGGGQPIKRAGGEMCYLGALSVDFKTSTLITETAQVRVDSVDSTSWRPFTCSGCTPCMCKIM